jgi:CDP-paratose 2-epimerase
MSGSHVAKIGAYESFRPGMHERVEQVLDDLQTLGIEHLRTEFSWADWCVPGGQAWYEWLLPRLARQVEVLPYFVSTPPWLGVVPKTSAPPREPKWYADFIDQVVTLLGAHFEWVELWSGPSTLSEWDIALDPDFRIFSEMVGGAAYWAKHRGKKTVLGSTGPVDANWVRLMCERNVMQYVDAVGIQGLPAVHDGPWEGWPSTVSKVKHVLERYGSRAQMWITGTGYSTYRHDERKQLSAFVEAIEAPVERVYWYSVRDRDAQGMCAEGPDYHFGLRRADGNRKLLFRLWETGGLEAVRNTAWWGEATRNRHRRRKPTLITGGAGFIGANLAHRLLSAGLPVLMLDNLSRPGVERNLQWLRDVHGKRVQIEVADVRDVPALSSAVARASRVYHFAAQTAVTTSLVNPVHDFEVNARGTLNLLEAIRAQPSPPPLVFTSTNKVYGGLPDVTLRLAGERYEPVNDAVRAFGIGEQRPIDFHSPYGCSKGTADHYVLDYARTFDLPALVFRMSCIYGPHQLGTEDQGWVAHFMLSSLLDQPIAIYGDGKQVRDVLFIDDLVDALLLGQEQVGCLSGQAFNLGGGTANTVSLLELIEMIGELHRPCTTTFGPWRTGDQRYYVSDIRKFNSATGWAPQVSVKAGVERLYQWLIEVIAQTRGSARSVVRAYSPAH